MGFKIFEIAQKTKNLPFTVHKGPPEYNKDFDFRHWNILQENRSKNEIFEIAQKTKKLPLQSN